VSPAAATPSASLVIQTSFLGDMVLTTPLIAELAKRGPVDVVAIPASAPLLANNPDVRQVIVYDKRGADSGISGFWRLARTLYKRAPIAYLGQGSVRSAALAATACIPRRVGFDTSAGRAMYTERVPNRDGVHHAERLWRLAGAVGEPSRDALRPRLYPGIVERQAVDQLLETASFGSDASAFPLVALAPGSVWATKRWPFYAALAEELAAVARIVVVGSKDDSVLAKAIVDAVGARRALDATGQLSLLASAELIGRAAAIVTNDSAPLHLASAMGTPTVAMFGPTIPEFGFGPLAPRAAVVQHEALACKPCDRHGPQRCPLGHWRCMRELSPTRVANIVGDYLATSHS
jgi:heptosyltransferase-2